MLTEFQVRRRIEAIGAARLAPLRKVRMLLRLGRSLETQAKSLAQVNARVARDPNAAAVLARMARNARSLRDDAREAALNALRDDPSDASGEVEAPSARVGVNCGRSACHGPPSPSISRRAIREFGAALSADSSKN